MRTQVIVEYSEQTVVAFDDTLGHDYLPRDLIDSPSGRYTVQYVRQKHTITHSGHEQVVCQVVVTKA